MAGTIPMSLTQQFDERGKPLVGGKLYVIQAGTVNTPQNAYKDVSLTLPHPNPIPLDSSGRVPLFFLADGTIKVRLTDRNGAEKFVGDGLPVTGPSGSGATGSTVDATTLIQTGWLQPIYGTGVVTGFARCNGRTIGNAASGATERANADTSALFVFLYNADTNLAVSGGRGASAAADYAANKTIALPDFRGRTIAGLDDMGNSAAGRLTATYFGTAATVLGAAGGLESHTLVAGNLPPYTPSGSVSVGGTITAQAPVRQYATTGANVNTQLSLASNVGADAGTLSIPVSGATASFFGNAQGGVSTPARTVQPTMLTTLYIKL